MFCPYCANLLVVEPFDGAMRFACKVRAWLCRHVTFVTLYRTADMSRTIADVPLPLQHRQEPPKGRTH